MPRPIEVLKPVYRVESGRRVLDGYELDCVAKFHQFTQEHEEFDNGAGNYAAAIVEYGDGSVKAIPVHLIRFTDSGTPTPSGVYGNDACRKLLLAIEPFTQAFERDNGLLQYDQASAETVFFLDKNTVTPAVTMGDFRRLYEAASEVKP